MSVDALPDIGSLSTAEIDGLVIRYARGGATKGTPILLTAPWPESIYAFRHVLSRLGAEHPLLAVDLPGFGHSASRPGVMAPEAMGDFVIALLAHFQMSQAHAVAPDVGAAARPDLAAGVLNDLIHSPPGTFASIDGAEAVKSYLSDAAKLTPAVIVQDFREASAGRRFEDAVQYVRAYISDLPKLEMLLPSIETPVLIIAGRNDPIVPPGNGQFLADRLPHNRYVLLDAGHRIWEEAPTDYREELANWIGGGHRLKSN